MEPTAPSSTPTHAASAAPKTASPAIAKTYESNPFKASISGLVTILKFNPMASILMGLVLILGFFAAYIVILILSAAVPVLGILLGIVAFVLFMPLITGAYTSLAISSVNGQTKTVKEHINVAIQKLGKTLVASILVVLAITGGLILLVVPGIIFGLWFSLTFYAMYDEDLDAIAAMKRSKELVSGHLWEMIGALFAGGLLSGGGFSSGGLLTQVISMAPLTGRYYQLKALKASGQAKPKVHYLNYLVVVVAIVFFAGMAALVTAAGNTTNTYNDTNTNKSTQELLDELNSKYNTESSNDMYNDSYNFSN